MKYTSLTLFKSNQTVKLVVLIVQVFLLSLDELQKFLRVTTEGLNQPVAKGDHQGLVKVMNHLLAVRDKKSGTDEMFEPLRDAIILLQRYGVTMPEQFYSQMEVGKIMG